VSPSDTTRASPLRHVETDVVQTMLQPTGRQCRGDPVGRPSVRRSLGSAVALRGTIVHDGTRATHRVAPTYPPTHAYANCASSHRGHPAYTV
jgi:hypothetical protein